MKIYAAPSKFLKIKTVWFIITDHPIGNALLLIVIYTFYDGIFRRGRS